MKSCTALLLHCGTSACEDNGRGFTRRRPYRSTASVEYRRAVVASMLEVRAAVLMAALLCIYRDEPPKIDDGRHLDHEYSPERRQQGGRITEYELENYTIATPSR